MSPPSSDPDSEASDEAVADAIESFEDQEPLLRAELRESILHLADGEAASSEDIDDAPCE